MSFKMRIALITLVFGNTLVFAGTLDPQLQPFAFPSFGVLALCIGLAISLRQIPEKERSE